MPIDPFTEQRRQMVEQQIRARGIRNERVLAAMEKVPRHVFVPEDLRRVAYDDRPLPIGDGQTISQPYIVALMTDLLDPHVGDRILEIGAGSGYQAAILAELASEVITIERIPAVAARARRNLSTAGSRRADVIVADGTSRIFPEGTLPGDPCHGRDTGYSSSAHRATRGRRPACRPRGAARGPGPGPACSGRGEDPA